MATDTGLDDLDLEQSEVEDKIEELTKLAERTPDQDAELKTLRGDRKNILENRIKHKHSEMLAERNRREKAEQELERLRTERQETAQNRTVNVGGSTQPSIVIGNDKFYSNEQLDALVKAGSMTQATAQEHYEERIEAKAAFRIRNENNAQNDRQTRYDDMQKVLGEKPEFNPQHPNHNPNDPLFKEADRIYRNGYQSNPKGLSLALEEARRILGVKNTRPDRSEDLSVTSSSTPADKTVGKKLELTKDEADYAIQFYCYGSMKNPTTGKSFTRQEALEKALRAKERKLKGRV